MMAVERGCAQYPSARWFLHSRPSILLTPFDVSTRRRMDQLIAGKPRIRKLFASLERSLEDEEHLMSLADNTRLNARQAP